MPYLVLPDRWRRAPRVPVQIDENSPFASGLVCVFALPLLVGRTMRQPWKANGSPARIAGPSGLALGFAAGSDYVSRPVQGAEPFAGDFTIMTFARWTSGPALVLGQLTPEGSWNGGANLWIQSGGNLDLIRGSVSYRETTNATLTSGTDGVFAVAGSSGTAANSSQIYMNGKAMAQTNNAASAWATSSNDLRLGAHSTGNALSYRAYMAAGWNRRQSAAAIADLSAAPWQMFRPRRPRAFFFAVAGGASYNVDVAESAAASDAVSAQAQFGVTLAETAAATDTLTTIATFARSVSEAASATDTVATGASTYPVTASEATAATDNLTTTATFPRTVTETAAATDAPSAQAIFPRTVAESASATDTVSSGAATYGVDLAEIATAAEALAALLNAGAALTESGAANDTVASLATLLAALTEAVTATDTQSSALGSGTYNVNLTEAASALDSLATQMAWARTVAETGNATDTVSALGSFGAVLAEAIAAVEALTASGITNVSVTEAATATDLLSAPTGFGETPAERVISIRAGDRVIRVDYGGRTIRVLN